MSLSRRLAGSTYTSAVFRAGDAGRRKTAVTHQIQAHTDCFNVRIVCRTKLFPYPLHLTHYR